MAVAFSAYKIQGQLQVKLHQAQDAQHLQTQLWGFLFLLYCTGLSILASQPGKPYWRLRVQIFISAFRWHSGCHAGKSTNDIPLIERAKSTSKIHVSVHLGMVNLGIADCWQESELTG